MQAQFFDDGREAAIGGLFLQSASSIDDAQRYGGTPLDFLRGSRSGDSQDERTYPQ
jgi:hypothetical protein